VLDLHTIVVRLKLLKTEKIRALEVLKKNEKAMYLCDILNDSTKMSDKIIWFGTGAATTTLRSEGYGLEVLNQVLASLELKRLVGAQFVMHMISNLGYEPLIDEMLGEKLLSEQKEQVETMIKSLCIQDEYKLSLLRDHANTEDFKSIREKVEKKLEAFKDLPNFKNYGRYTIWQTTAVKYYYEMENVRVKVGWVKSPEVAPKIVDSNFVRGLIEKSHLSEFHFDSIYRYVFPNDELSFVYSLPAQDFKTRMKAIPYTVTANELRPLWSVPFMKFIDDKIISTNDRKLRIKTNSGINALNRSIVRPFLKLFSEYCYNNGLSETSLSPIELLANIQAIVSGKGPLSRDKLIETELIIPTVKEKPITELNIAEGYNIIDLLLIIKLCNSKSNAKWLVRGGGISINGKRVDDIAYFVSKSDFVDGELIVRKGKKTTYKINQNDNLKPL